MPDYIQDPNDSNKQVPGPKSDQHFDRTAQPGRCRFTKQPHYVIVNVAETVAFFFGSSGSFSAKSTAEGDLTSGDFLLPTGSLSSSQHYISFGAPAVGTKYDINPSAWSGSATQNVTFVYKGGLDGQGRP